MKFFKKGRKVISRIFKNSFALFNYGVSNHFERFELYNGLDVLLVNSDSFTKSSIILTLDSGAIYDPEDTKGLAHLLEHMILEGSKKYPKENELINLIKQNSGYFQGTTELEFMKFSIQIKHSKFEKVCDILANSIAKPLFSESFCESQINLIEQKYQKSVTNISENLENLFNFTLEETLPERRFIVGNRKTLKTPNILMQLRDFHQKYFTSNRMQLVIASKLSLIKLRDLASLFSIIPEGEFKPGCHRDKKVKFNQKYEIGSLIKEKEDVKVNEKHSGCLVKFNLKDNVNFLYISIPISLGSVVEHRPLEYIYEIFQGQMKGFLFEELKKMKLIKTLNFSYKTAKRYSKVCISAELTNEGVDRKNEVLAAIYEFLNTHYPMEEIFDFIRSEAENQFKEPKDSLIAAKVFGNCMDCSSYSFYRDFFTNYEFDEKAIIDVLNQLGNIKNWAVLLSVNDSSLPNKLEYYPVQYGNPENLDLNTSNCVRRNLTKMKVDVEESSIIASFYKKYLISKLERKFIHSQLSNGEYSILFDNKISKDYCEIEVFFITKNKEKKENEKELFCSALINRIKKLKARNQFNCLFFVDLNCTNEKKIKIYGSSRDVIYGIDTLATEIKTFKPSEFEIKTAKIDLEKYYKEQRNTDLYEKTMFAFTSFVKNIEFNNNLTKDFNNNNLTKDFNNNNLTQCFNFYQDYYINIVAIGDINEDFIVNFYDQLKSTGTKNLTNNLNLSDKRFEFENNDISNSSLMIGYNLKSESNYKTGAISLLLKSIFSNNERSRDKYFGFTQVDFTIIDEEFFLIFFFKFDGNISETESSFMKSMKNYKEIIQNISDTDFLTMKDEINSKLTISTQEINGLNILLKEMISYGEYSFELFENLKNCVNLATKEELINLNLNELKPLIISSSKRKLKNE